MKKTVSISLRQIQAASNKFFQKPTNRNREELQKCKTRPQETYDTITEEELDKMIREVEAADLNSKQNMINEITDRKTTKQCITKARDKKDRINKWYTHFKDLLGKELVLEGEMDAELTSVLQEMGISDDPFTAKEYAAVKKSIKEGNACRPYRPCRPYEFCKQTFRWGET